MASLRRNTAGEYVARKWPHSAIRRLEALREKCHSRLYVPADEPESIGPDVEAALRLRSGYSIGFEERGSKVDCLRL